ncbi:sphingomyelin phosphodiesterase [Talaromyces islandicus]|uniref:Sphingomyelin phosphodiesterase n=1 Tax=Talaromyces islandicus TaxID=28573 RepID=A0A0U1LUR5_TALIS|nr:sphingomyelin phosphodiesterase [Talaromyces islandicus]
MRQSFILKALVLGLAICDQTSSSALVDRDLASEIWDDIKNAATCAGCQVILAALKGVSDLGTTVLVDTLTEVCKLSGAEDDDVCEGIISREGPVLHYILSQLSLGSETSDALCASAFGLCPYPDVRNYTLTFLSAKPENSTRPSSSGESPIQVVHFSDTHVDLSYETGSNWNCSKPICCRSFETSDAPGNTTTPCGPYGNTKCDAPLSLEESMVNSIKSLAPAPAFSIYTGDVVAHDIWLVDEDEVLTDLNATYGLVAEVGTIYAAIGNHDTAPVNDLPTSQVSNTYSANWTYQALAANFTHLSGDSSIMSVAENYGSYSSIFSGSHGTDLKVISYNSIFYYVDNFYAFLDPMPYDPDGQLAWLIDELQAAETAGQRVWLIAHVPTGSSDHFHDYSHYFDQIVQRYDASIAALFFGHTHTDQFQIAYSDYSNQNADTATAMGYIMPSLTPTSGPPAYRVYDIDPVTFGVLDFTVYIANISDPDYQNGPTWAKYYSAKETYGSLLSPPVTDPSAELTPAFWHNVTAVFETNDAAFQGYWARQTRGYDVSNCTDSSCKNQTICALRAADSQYNCVVPSIGFNFAKRDGTDQAHVMAQKEKCDDAGLVSLLGRIISKSRDV